MRDQTDNFTDANAARVLEPRYLVELSFSAPAASPTQNQLTRSEEFDNAAWTASGTPVITANSTAAPDGTTTADTIEDNDGAAFEYVYQNGASIDTDRIYTASIYILKDSTGRATRFPGLRLSFLGSTTEDNTIYLDTNTGEYGTAETVAGFVTAGVEDAGPNYWRAWVTSKSDDQSNTSVRVSVYPAFGASATWVESAATTGSAIVWGAQLIESDQLTDYSKTEATADTSETNLVYGNMLKQSEAFGAFDWSTGGSPVITANSTAAPDGTTTADTIEDDGGGIELIFQDVTIDGTKAHTFSLFIAKDSTGRATRFPEIDMQYSGSTFEINAAGLDTATGDTNLRLSPSDDVSAGVVDYDANWWRVWLTATSNDTANTTINVRIFPAAGASATWVTSAAATGSIIAWGAQLSESDRLLPYYPTDDHIIVRPTGRDLVRYYVSSHSDTLTPDNQGANVIHGAIKNISGQSQQIKPDSARHTIGSVTISFSDVEARLTNLINLNLEGGDGLNKKRIRLYKGHESLTDFDDYSLRLTYLVRSIDYKDGVYNVLCDDIQRSEKTTIFEPDQGALTKSILSTSDEIPITIANGADKFATFAHDANYSANPSVTVGYIKIDDEVIAHSGWTDGTYTALDVVERGALNTRAVSHTITQTTTDQKKRVTEYVYLEGPAISMIYALLTGIIYGQGETLPDNWHLGIDTDFVRASDFYDIGTDLWDLSDDTGRRARFIGTEPTEAKEFIERELLLWLNCFMPVYADGAFGVKRLKGVTPDSGFDAYLDEDEIISYGSLRHDMKSLINNMSIKWNWIERLDTFSKTTFLIDSDSIAKHDKSKLKEFEFKGVFNGVHSDSDIFNYFSAIRDRYANPPELLQLEVMPEWDRLEVGDTARVVCSQIRDYAKTETLDRVFEIQQIKTDWVTGKVWLQLFGGIEKATELTLSSSNVMADAYYTTGGTELSTVLTISGDAITANGTLNGAASNTSAIFYYDGDLTLNSGVTLTINRNVLLRIKGTFTINGTINLEGNSADAGTVGVTYSGYSARIKYTGASRSRPIEVSIQRSSNISRGAYPELPVFNVLNPDGLEIQGIPTNLSGRKGGTGTAGRASGVGTADGGAGGIGGGGMVVVSRGGAIGPNGSIDSSGTAGSESTDIESVFTVDVYGQTGAGGFPGGVFWLIDGNYSFPAFTSDNFTASRGASDPPATIDVYATGKTQQIENDNDDVYGQRIIDNANYFEACTRIQFVPPAENGYVWMPEDERKSGNPNRKLSEILISNLEQLKSVPTGGPFAVALTNGSLFVCAGLSSGSDTEIITSPDGRVWTERSNPGTASSDDMQSGIFGGDNFVLCGGDLVTNGSVLYSADGITWSKVTPTNHRNFHDVAFGDGVYVLVGNDDGTDASIFTATTPATWTERSNPKAFDLRGVCYSAELGLWAAGGQADGTDAYLITASDPTGTWTERSNPQNRNIISMAAGNGVIVGVGSDGSTTPYFIYSSDGITWSETSDLPLTNETPAQVRFIDGAFYAVGSYIDVNNGAVLWRSVDGIKWSALRNPAPDRLGDIAFDGATFVLALNLNPEGVLISPRIESE